MYGDEASDPRTGQETTRKCVSECDFFSQRGTEHYYSTMKAVHRGRGEVDELYSRKFLQVFFVYTQYLDHLKKKG